MGRRSRDRFKTNPAKSCRNAQLMQTLLDELRQLFPCTRERRRKRQPHGSDPEKMEEGEEELKFHTPIYDMYHTTLPKCSKEMDAKALTEPPKHHYPPGSPSEPSRPIPRKPLPSRPPPARRVVHGPARTVTIHHPRQKHRSHHVVYDSTSLSDEIRALYPAPLSIPPRRHPSAPKSPIRLDNSHRITRVSDLIHLPDPRPPKTRCCSICGTRQPPSGASAGARFSPDGLWLCANCQRAEDGVGGHAPPAPAPVPPPVPVRSKPRFSTASGHRGGELYDVHPALRHPEGARSGAWRPSSTGQPAAEKSHFSAATTAASSVAEEDVTRDTLFMELCAGSGAAQSPGTGRGEEGLRKPGAHAAKGGAMSPSARAPGQFHDDDDDDDDDEDDVPRSQASRKRRHVKPPPLKRTGSEVGSSGARKPRPALTEAQREYLDSTATGTPLLHLMHIPSSEMTKDGKSRRQLPPSSRDRKAAAIDDEEDDGFKPTTSAGPTSRSTTTTAKVYNPSHPPARAKYPSTTPPTAPPLSSRKQLLIPQRSSSAAATAYPAHPLAGTARHPLPRPYSRQLRVPSSRSGEEKEKGVEDTKHRPFTPPTRTSSLNHSRVHSASALAAALPPMPPLPTSAVVGERSRARPQTVCVRAPLERIG